mgnify:CR=1 FL=1
MSPVFDLSDEQGRTDGIAAAVEAARMGRCVVLPTDTVYGIGTDAFSAALTARPDLQPELDALLRTIRSPLPTPARATQPRVAVLHVGGLAPGAQARRAVIRIQPSSVSETVRSRP